MKALDTNVLVRFLVADDAAQAEAVRRLFRAAERERETLLVTSAVVLETIWVLGSVYGASRGEILDAIGGLGRLTFLAFERPDLPRRLEEEGRRSRADLADLFIGICGSAAGCTATLTFDRRLGRNALFETIEKGS